MAVPDPKELVAGLVGARVSSTERASDGIGVSVGFEGATGGGRIVAHGIGEGWRAGDTFSAADLADDGTLTLVAAETAFVARPNADFESWAIDLPGAYSPIVCGAGGVVEVLERGGRETWWDRLRALFGR